MRGGEAPTRVGELVQGVLEDAGVAEDVRRQEVLGRWDEAVGEKIAAVTRAVRIDNEVLFVEVRSSAWLMELEMMKRTILERVNEGRDGGSVEKVRFVLAEHG